MIKFVNVNKNYNNGKVIALSNINLTIQQGEFISIVGRSGAGKSTLLAMITLEERPTTGKIFIEGQDITKIKQSDAFYLRRKIGVVFQDIKLLPARTAAENVGFAMEVGGIPGNTIEPTLGRGKAASCDSPRFGA